MSFLKLGNVPLVHPSVQRGFGQTLYNLLPFWAPKPGASGRGDVSLGDLGRTRSYGVGITAVTWLENELSDPSLATAVVT